MATRFQLCKFGSVHPLLLLRPKAVQTRASCAGKGFGQNRMNSSQIAPYINDIEITRTGKAFINSGGGRSSLGGRTATVFGATGFLGRYIVNRLAQSGCTVVIPYREEIHKRHLKVTGDLGRVVMMEYDLRNIQSIEDSVRHSDTVYNLIGRDYTTKNFDFEDVHVDGAASIAEAVAKYDVDRFIHVSSFNADQDSPSDFFRSKARGEEVVRQIFPETTIVRPSVMFGREDRLLNHLAQPIPLLVSNRMQEKYWPVHVIDVGTALERMIHDQSTSAQTYELYGPKKYSIAQMLDLVNREIVRTRMSVNVPKIVRKHVLDLMNRVLWWNVGCGDQVEREFIDQKIDPNAKTFADLGMKPGDLPNLIYPYLLLYRNWSMYDLPPMTSREMKEAKKYVHVFEDQ